MSNQIFNDLLRLAVENGASDIHVKSGKPGYLRLSGRLTPVDMDPIQPNDAQAFVEENIPESFMEAWNRDGQIDFAYSPEDLGRFRVNGFHQRGLVSLVFRHIQSDIPSFSDLGIEADVLTRLCQSKDGIILVCGATGSGKSSTLAAMLNWINTNLDKHIVTLEDPIEFNFKDKKSVFNQREIGIDAGSFQMGLKAALRQDPDIILIGEMRDQHTFETALSAAETGHLVLSTLHSNNVSQAILRLFELFPPEQQVQMRRQIAGCIRAIVSQRLLPAMEGGGRVPSMEILVMDGTAQSFIQEGNFDKIPALLEAGGENGSRSFNKDLLRLIKAGRISKADGLAFSSNPRALEMNLKGIFLSEGGIVG